MNRFLLYTAFFGIGSVVMFLLHWFVYRCLVRSVVETEGWQRLLWWFLIISGGNIPFSMICGRFFKVYLFTQYAYLWLGVITIASFIFSLHWLVVKIFPRVIKPSAITALAIIAVIFLVSLYNGLRFPVLKRYDIPIQQLPAELSGFTIVQLSDLHLEPYNSSNRMKKIVDLVNQLNPDLIVFTGDLADGDICSDDGLCRQLRRLKAKYGVMAVTGNHEFYSGIDIFMNTAHQTGIKVLRNESVTIAGSLQIIGLDEDTSTRFGDEGPNMDKAFQNTDPTKPMILLYHRPMLFDQAIQRGVDLQLSGHTHAGQYPPMDLLVFLYYKYPWGLYQKKDSFIYTSAGTDIWGPPLRFLSCNEIVLFTLKAIPSPGKQETSQ